MTFLASFYIIQCCEKSRYKIHKNTIMASSPTDLELVIFNFIKNQYEKKSKQNVPMALKYLTIQFSKKIIGCNLLTIKEGLHFFNLLLTKLPSILLFKFLFRASDHEYSAKKFHEHCDGKPGTITIIKSNWGHVFGGYTSKSWKSSPNGENVKDENAFLFLIKSDKQSLQIKCPLLLELRKDQVDCAIHCSRNCGHQYLVFDNMDEKLKEKYETNYSERSRMIPGG